MTSAPCLGCGCMIESRDDYCAGCWDDLIDWLGWEPTTRSHYRRHDLRQEQ